MFDDSNHIFRTAFNFVNQTGQSVFLTGKAGTGKTTFLKYIRDHCYKKMAIVAPTGVAAINAGGVTMHSFFQLPFGLYVPERLPQYAGLNDSIADPHTLFQNIRFNSDKRTLLQELELLIIDEVSMVRADMLDAVDMILRHFRQQLLLPFGGVQILYIGDLFQLPPVVQDREWDTLHRYYKSPFFFDARVLQQSPPVYIELSTIYRQNEASFIRILNNIRNNRASQDDLERLHEFYRPGFVPPAGEHYITLTTHNAKAAAINQTELQKLSGKEFSFEATITGEFSDRSFPVEKTLSLKCGAQIMFIRNDKGELRRYYNGKIGTIRSISEDRIEIVFDEEPEGLVIEKETWRNIRYHYKKESDTIEEEELGSFSQYPIRLAWAITIHKSQGLTFQRAVIDAGASFAAGQVYVALSRLTSIEGLVLYSRIQPHNISTDDRIVSFAESALSEERLHHYLREEQKIFAGQMIKRAFYWTRLVADFEEHIDQLSTSRLPEKINAFSLARKWLAATQAQAVFAQKFTLQLEHLLAEANLHGYAPLHQRMEAAATFFKRSLKEELIQPLQEHITEFWALSRIKKYLQQLNSLKLLVARKEFEIEQARRMAETLAGGTHSELLDTLFTQKFAITEEAVAEMPLIPKPGTKPKRGDSRLMSLALFKEGKKLAAIASQRGLAASTIAEHLASFITTGEIEIKELVAEDKIHAILGAITTTRSSLANPIREQLGPGYSFGEIRAVINYHNLQNRKTD